MYGALCRPTPAPNNAPYQFTVNCDAADSDICKSGTTVAFTEAEPQADDITPRVMHICPLFFSKNSKETVNDLGSRQFGPPAKRGQPETWCQGGNNFAWYEVAGHTLLHEMTHFDALGKYAGPPEVQEDDFKAHGTDDVGGLGKSYPVAARKLATLWQKKPNGNYLVPYRNAESLAGSALEIFMMSECEEVSEIRLARDFTLLVLCCRPVRQSARSPCRDILSPAWG